MSEDIIGTVDLTYRYSGNDDPSLDDVNIRIRKGVKTVILGANGAGKSTLFYHFNGVYRPSSGTVSFDGAPLSYRRKARMTRYSGRPWRRTSRTVPATSGCLRWRSLSGWSPPSTWSTCPI